MFEIMYTPLEADFGWLSLMADGMNLTEYSYEGKNYCGICRIKTLAAWLKQHKAVFLEDDPFPVTSHGDTGASLWMNSDAYLDGEEFHEKRQAMDMASFSGCVQGRILSSLCCDPIQGWKN